MSRFAHTFLPLGYRLVFGIAVALFLSGCWLKFDYPDAVPIVTGSPDSTALVVVDCDAYYDPGSSIELSSSIVGDLVSQAIDDALEPEGERMSMLGGKIVDANDRVYRGEASREGPPVLVFSNLAPGRYRLTELSVSHSASVEEVDEEYDCERPTHEKRFVVDECPVRFEFTYELTAEAQDDLTVEVEAGETYYLGKLRWTETERPPYGGVHEVGVTKKGVLGDYYTATVMADSAHRRDQPVVRFLASPQEEWAAWSSVLETLRGKTAGTTDLSWIPRLQARVEALAGVTRRPDPTDPE